MASLIGFGRRNWTANRPPSPVKSPDAIRIGLFGASWIAPQAVIIPAKSHPEVIVAAIAARDLKRAQAYAKKHGIPNAHGSYQALLDDPSIDAVYIPLPNGLHYEWTVKALRAGKHVLVEKPFVSNAKEATSLVKIHEAIPSPKPVMLEAVHYTFHPSWQTFLSLLSPPHITSVHSSLSAPAYFFPKDDIRFIYHLAGGTCMDMGTYGISTLRQIFRTMPSEIISAEPRIMPKPYDQLCDQAMKASWRFPSPTDSNGAIGNIDVDLAKSKFGVLPALDMPAVVVQHAPVPVTTKSLKVKLQEGQSHTKTRTVTMWNHIAPVVWHRIDVVDEHVVKASDGKIVRKWTVKESKKAYVWPDDLKSYISETGEGAETSGAAEDAKVRTGAEYWSTYRYMIEEFVNKIKGRPGSGVWVSGEDSVNGMVMIDQAYEKCGLGVRPTSNTLE